MKKFMSLLLVCCLVFALACGCMGAAFASSEEPAADSSAVSDDAAYIEETLNLANNPDQEWTHSSNAWVLSVVTAVAYPELENQEGVSVAVPDAYVAGIDTDGDGEVDVTAATASGAVKGSLVIDYDAEVESGYGQTYTAATAPIILTTGAAGYGSQTNQKAGTSYCSYGYISVACGNRGKQDTAVDENGNTYYTGDAPSCLVDQKAAIRYVKYNILLGNLPGDVDLVVSTGGSGGAAHAAMFAATSNAPDFYDYEIEVGAVGVYNDGNGGYSTTVTIDGEDYEISDGAWGCVAYSAITSLYEGDAAQAFEYYMDPTFSFKTDFQAQLAEYLSAEYMEYINAKELSVEEAAVGFDLDGDGELASTIDLTIEYDLDAYPETNGYGGSYLDLYLAEFTSNLQWYLDNLDYATGWTWFDENGDALSDEDVAAMTSEDRAVAFIEGRYSSGSTSSGPGGASGGPMSVSESDGLVASSLSAEVTGGPTAGTTQSATGAAINSSNYATFEEMAEAYASDIAEIEEGDQYGKNIVDLYNPINYIGAEGTDDPTWTRIVMGAREGDMPMMASLNMEIAWLNAGTDAVIEWQWDGGHVPSEVLGESLALYVDEMYGEYISGVETTKPEADPITTNGTAESATGRDLSDWVDYEDVSNVSFSLADVLAYRNGGASKSVPGFDTIDYGQEDYVFGSSEQDARHWSTLVNNIFQNEEYAAVLADLF